ncbi:MAG TPA: MMPL family transporter, partial [Candidatus Poseidoniaceae archaeon]|nr:MMPL family transporter [Candidatus Poseidoniaceae archaeon]
MKNPFEAMSNASVSRPKSVFAVVMLAVLILASGGMHLQFDNSEDGFFPDDENVRLLEEIEREYQASIDFVRVIDEIETGSLLTNETWEHLAMIEARMIEDENFAPYHYPLFGTQANSGMAGYAYQWQRYQDPMSADWIAPLESAIGSVLTADNDSLGQALGNLSAAAEAIPSASEMSGADLINWNAGTPSEWLPRLDNGANLSSDLGAMLGLLELTTTNRSGAQIGQIMAVTGPMNGQLGLLSGLQSIDYRAAILGSLPVVDRTDDPWNSSGPVLTTLVVSTEPADYGVEILGDVQAMITNWSDLLVQDLQADGAGDGLRTFSFSQFSEGANANLGKEIGTLTSAALLLLAVILWFNFRSVRDTAFVTSLTVLAILATYGLSGWLQFFGVNMVFNAAMNSIPVLLLAIGVDYGLHVVIRIREELNLIDSKDDIERATLKDFSYEARQVAVRRGTVLTSIALVIAIFTDMVGFLSFRFSSLSFLQVFGTVIAIGLFLVYLLSITALPALMLMFPPKKLKLEKASSIEIGPIANGLARLSATPLKVGVIAVVLLAPMFIGFQQLEVGFDQRDQFDEDVPVVGDFLLLSDEFQNSRSPLYVVVDVEVFTPDGYAAWLAAEQVLLESPDVSGAPSGLWNLLAEAQVRDSTLNGLMSQLDDTNQSTWDELATYMLETPEGRELSSSVLASDGQQTVLSFQAETLDWQATIDLNQRMIDSLESAEEGLEGDANLRVGGRSLILAQTTSDVADSAIMSTGIVAVVILMMLVGIHSVRQRDVVQGMSRGFVSWIPLMMVVVWVYGLMGFTGYQINSQTVTIGALSLGLGVDYAVHFSIRLEEEVEHNPFADPHHWVA